MVIQKSQKEVTKEEIITSLYEVITVTILHIVIKKSVVAALNMVLCHLENVTQSCLI